jgi:uncharacterized protein YkwD
MSSRPQQWHCTNAGSMASARFAYAIILLNTNQKQTPNIMTLVTRPKPAAHYKKVSGKHHRQNKDYHKAYWPYIPLLAIVSVGLLLNTVWNPRGGVLGYATDMSVQSLLDDTNTDRASNGLGALTLNSQLDQAAQTKANDMIARDYWSHNTPDGQTPWSFITAAGYDYQTAGENLAYGFTTAADTLTGWMNSPEHKANILNTTYQEVGFGYANGPNYNGDGQETLVVAMYAEPTTPAVAAATPPTTSTPITATASQSNGQSAGQSTAGASAVPTSDPTTSATLTPTATSASSVPQKTALAETKPQKITRVQLLTAGKMPWSSFALSILAATALLLFFMRHGIAWHKVLRKGEKFVLNHKLLDTALVTLLVLAFILTRTTGVIR